MLNNTVGEISSEELLSAEDMSLLKDNLYFDLTYTTIDGATNKLTLKLNIKKFN